MAEMKVSNETVIERANEMKALIQGDRHKTECENLTKVRRDFESYNTKWIFNRNFKDWFKSFGPFALIGFVFYPLDILFRWYEIYNKPRTNNPFKMSEWIDKIEDNTWFSDYKLESSEYENQYELCTKLKCMAKNNEDDFMMITKEEARSLGIC